MADERNPWTTGSSRIAYRNPWFSVREDQVIRPDGKPGLYCVMEKCSATGVVAVNSNHEVYLIGQYRYPVKEYSWEIVEGGTDEGESPLAAAQRELREEAGLTASDWLQLGSELHLSNCISSETGFLYLARGLKEVTPCPEGTEILCVKKMIFSEALQLVHTGGIKDAMSIIAMLRADEFL